MTHRLTGHHVGHVVRCQASGGGGSGCRSRGIVEDPAATGTMVAAVMMLRLLLLLLPEVIVVDEVRRRGQEDTGGIAETLVRRGSVICKVQIV